MINYLCELCKKKKKNISCVPWSTLLMWTNYWSHQVEQDFHAPSRQNLLTDAERRAVIGPPRWVFPHSAQSCQQRRMLERGDCRVCAETSSVIPWGISDPSPGSRDALHAHQYADPTGVYPRICEWLLLEETRWSLEIQGFIDLAEKQSAR